MLRRIVLLALAPALLLSCRDATDPGPPDGGARVSVSSDPPGARILLDGRHTGLITPDTVAGLSRRHDIAARIDTLGVAWGFLAQVVANPDSVPEIHGPLVMRCPTESCWAQHHRVHTHARLRFATNPVGSLFTRDGRGGGLAWPAGTADSYSSGGMPVLAAISENRDTVALGVYDQRYLAGRPVPEVAQTAERFELRQATWVLPPADALTFRTVRGIEVTQHLIAEQATEGVAVVRLVFRNITNNRAYRAADPIVPAQGMVYDRMFIGFALDPDIGVQSASPPDHDWISYAPELNMVFAYDADFHVGSFAGAARTAPGLVGLRVLEAPAGTRIVLNAWAHTAGTTSVDWRAGTANERRGYGMLSGLQSYAPAHADLRIGHLPTAPGDMRMSVSAGPLALVPGDSAAITIAVIVAPPVEGTFVSGMTIEPGDPFMPARSIAQVAAHLFDRARAAELILP